MTNFPARWGHAYETGVCPCASKHYLQQCSSALLILKPSMAFKIPLLDSLSLTKGYFHDIPNFCWADVTDKDETGRESTVSQSTISQSTVSQSTVSFRFVSFRKVP